MPRRCKANHHHFPPVGLPAGNINRSNHLDARSQGLKVGAKQ